MTTDSKVKSDNAISLGTNIKKLRLEHSFTQAYMVRQMQLLGCNTTCPRIESLYQQIPLIR